MAKPSRKAASPETPARSNTAGLPPEDDNIDKVRDILFGSQTRQIEKRLAAMEEKIDKEIGYLRSETKTTLDSLEQFMRKELQTLTEQLGDERTERNESVDSLSEKIGGTKKLLEKKMGQLSDKLVKDQRETQEQILKQSKTLMEEMHNKNDVIEKRLDQSLDALTHEKTDRMALANLLMEAAMRLKDEFQLPEAE